ncbi:MAG: hypothetical protein NTY47_07425, partial [Candidatus Omnitrophica bacterium]|nr:hypothetical protein [Candidatus Omnitrophota bacterium]
MSIEEGADEKEFLKFLFDKAMLSGLSDGTAVSLVARASRDMYATSLGFPVFRGDLSHMIGAHILLSLMKRDAADIIKDQDLAARIASDDRGMILDTARLMGSTLRNRGGIDFDSDDGFMKTAASRQDTDKSAIENEKPGFIKMVLEWIKQFVNRVR